MPTFQFEAMDATGAEIKDVIEAPTEEEAQATIRQMGYFVTKINVKKVRKKAETASAKKKNRGFVFGGVKSRELTTFTRQLSILQDAGLPIVRSLRILAEQAKPGRLKYSLEDTCEEIEGGSTLSEAMSKSPKCFDRLYVNMIKAGEAGGALELILQRLADFKERSESLKRKIKGAMIYPVVVVTVAVGILTFIMIAIVPAFEQIFDDFGLELPTATLFLVAVSNWTVNYWYLIPGIPVCIWLFIKLLRKFRHGRIGWDQFTLKVPIFGPLVEQNILARTTRTLGTLIASGVPILEALNITRDTAGNAIFERMYQKISDAIREGEAIAAPMKLNSVPGFHPIAALFWFCFVGGPIGLLLYLLKYKQRIVDDLVVNMVDVGEETGELDTMLYKIADVYDELVAVRTDSLTKLLEPLLVIFLGGAVGFIVIALFIPLVKLIEGLS
ncbi:type II secretion system F family protein [Botrimarina mediterranea]|uniref:Type II secretion system protein F n=1 Tax=Botrimarina mediterranea TaxID=2528022 RepID=A0A518K302_9BACT|nr:type II secretion system F family protein [Botrimarina mediterranea]QDV72157.1 Type II secretion system protein F [Botrimarina mediterranea]QDV76699.1 Type II secretion system protein F [Planctomycetes bacterium K2D]